MRRGSRWFAPALVLVALVTAAALGGASAQGAGKKPIVIGAAIDMTNFKKDFNLPALTAAKLEVKKINAKGGVLGRKLQFKTEDTTLDPGRTKSAALDLLDKGADIGWVTCDVDYAAPAVQEFLSQKKLAIAPCIGTDQMGPKRFSTAGKLAFSFGNVAQDEGSALAEMTYKKLKKKTAIVVTDNLLFYTKNVCAAFTQRYRQLGGKIVRQESFTTGDKTINNVVSRVNSTKAAAIALCTVTQADLPTFVAGLRSVGNKTPIVSPWSADGTFWTNSRITNFYVITFASVFGDDPSKQVRSLIRQMKGVGPAPVTGGFITGAQAIDALAYAIKKTKSTDGTKLAARLQKLHNFKTPYGAISFSSRYHTVFGRTYRIIKITGKKAKFVGTVRAGTPANIG